MKIGHPSKLRVLLITLIFGSATVLAQTKPAHAVNPAGAIGVLYLMILSTASVVASLWRLHRAKTSVRRTGTVSCPE